MGLRNNYLIQAQQAKQLFVTYDQQALCRKLGLEADEVWLYTAMLRTPYRIHRKTGDVQCLEGEIWVEAERYEEVMTLLDLVCDSREDRFLTGRWKNQRDFGLQFHRNLLEDPMDPWAQRFQTRPEDFRAACEALGGQSLPHGDISYAIELFDGLCIAVQLWFGDEEFPPNLRFLWDENALMYLRYETMYFAKDLLLQRIREQMEKGGR